MRTMFSSRITSTLLICTLLMAATCASGEANTNSANDTTSITIPQGKFVVPTEIDDTTRITIAKGLFVNPSEVIGVLQPISATRLIETADPASQTEINRIQDPATIAQNELFVNVMSAPSEKSRTIAELKSGQPIKVLKTKDSWLKITWQIDNTLNQGWLKKTFVEGKTIHAHR